MDMSYSAPHHDALFNLRDNSPVRHKDSQVASTVLSQNPVSLEQHKCGTYLMEFIGTFLLVAVITSGTILGGGQAPGIGVGAALIGLIYMSRHVSGAQCYNPAATACLYANGQAVKPHRFKFQTIDFVVCIFAQLLGSYAAAILMFSLVNKPTDPDWIGCSFGPGKLISTGRNEMQITLSIFALELVGTAGLCFIMLETAVASTQRGNEIYGLAIGLWVLGAANTIGTHTGCSINPAVTIGVVGACVTRGWDDPGRTKYIWVYIVAQMLGGVIAPIIYKITNPEEGAKE